MIKKREVKVCNLSRIADFATPRLVRLVRVLDELPNAMAVPQGWISVAVMDDEDLSKIHADFLNDPAKTDVITFEGDPDDNFAGEICVSAQRAFEVSKEFSNTPDAELCLYIAHGFLHLAGIDDISAEDSKKMRDAEAVAAALIKRKFRKPVFNFKEKKYV